MDFDGDIRNHVLEKLPFDEAKRPELEAKSTPELLAIYFNWANRLVPAQPRIAHQSRSLAGNPVSIARKLELDQLVDKITRGDDLAPHLSRGIKKGYDSPGTGSYGRRADLDLLLGEWQIHHLHLSNTLESDGFVERGDSLLFVAFRPNDAYLIDVFTHKDWTREAVANILIDEWPTCGLVHEAKGVLGLSHHTTESERLALRSAGINAPFMEHKGKYYMIGLGGLTSAGTSVTAARHANHVLLAAKNFAEHVLNDPTYITNAIESAGRIPAVTHDLHLVFMHDGSCSILEKNSLVLFPLY